MASYPDYSADFFDGKHYVMKGASPVTGRELVRRSFRNWFRANYPHVYATFRLVTGSAPMTLPTSLGAPPAESVRDFAAEVRRDLALTPKQIQSKYLYDGARLDALRGDLPAALVPDHARRGAPSLAVRAADRGVLRAIR